MVGLRGGTLLHVGVMSEHQLYIFEAIDRRLTHDERAELREISSRAEITATRFENTYNYGDLRGDPREMVKAYFDAHYYCANWGTRRLIFRFPTKAVPRETLAPYAVDERVEVWGDRSHTCVEFIFGDEGGGWDEGYEDFEAFGDLVTLRGDILRGDHRALYIAWLGSIYRVAGAEWFDLDDPDDAEFWEAVTRTPPPPVPAGLSRLSGEHERLMAVFGLDPGVIAAAAQHEPKGRASGEPSARKVRAAIKGMEPSAKDDWLARVALGEVGAAQALQREVRGLCAASSSSASAQPPTLDALFEAAGALRAERNRLAAEAKRRRAEEEAQRQARAREARIREVYERWDASWSDVDIHILQRKRSEYRRAAELMRDLGEAAARFGREVEFQRRLKRIHATHPTLRALRDELSKVGLGA